MRYLRAALNWAATRWPFALRSTVDHEFQRAELAARLLVAEKRAHLVTARALEAERRRRETLSATLDSLRSGGQSNG